MQIHIHADKQGNVVKTDLIIDSKTHTAFKRVAWEGEYVTLEDKIYSLEWLDYLDHKVTDQFIYELVEIKAINDLNFMLNIDNTSAV